MNRTTGTKKGYGTLLFPNLPSLKSPFDPEPTRIVSIYLLL